jgi:hypothetical protein
MCGLVILLAAIWQSPGAAHRTQEPDEPGTVTIDRRQLKMPIMVDPARAAEIDQLVLFLSTDKGKTWKAVAKGPATQRFFLFDAPAAGLYWFSIQAVSKDGSANPKDMSKEPPMLRIRVTRSEQAASQGDPTPTDNSRAAEGEAVRQLRAEVIQLRSRVEQLERRLADNNTRNGNKPAGKN